MAFITTEQENVENKRLQVCDYVHQTQSGLQVST